jgi:predicted nucleic-acid-binding protein
LLRRWGCRTLDANVLARYYIDDEADAEGQRQRLAAWRLIESGRPLMVSKSVVLELEWVMRGYYSFDHAEVVSVMRHLLEQAHITVEDRDAVLQALANVDAGLDFADALHHASHKSCDSVEPFDDRNFARRARKLGLAPAVMVLT